MKKIAYVGIDFHLKTLTCAVLIENERHSKWRRFLENISFDILEKILY